MRAALAVLLGLAVSASALAGPPVDALLPGQPGVLRGHGDVVLALAFSTDGLLVASVARDATARVWRLADGRELARLDLPREPASALALSPDAGVLAVGDLVGAVRLLEVRTDGGVLSTLDHPGAVAQVKFGPGVDELAVASQGGRLRVYAGDGGVRLDSSGRSLAFVGTRLLASTAQGVTALDVASGRVLQSWKLKDWPPLGQASFSASGDRVLSWTPTGLKLRVYSLQGRGAPPVELATPGAGRPDVVQPVGLNSAVLSSDGALVVAASSDQLVRVWDVRKQDVVERFPLERLGTVAVSPDGRTLAVADGALIKVWRLPGTAR